jgi:hypothetical protein
MTKQSKALFQWIVLYEEEYSKIPSWDHDNLIKSKKKQIMKFNYQSWSLIGRKKLNKKKKKNPNQLG